jgi:hypothetical protein
MDRFVEPSRGMSTTPVDRMLTPKCIRASAKSLSVRLLISKPAKKSRIIMAKNILMFV